VPGLDGGTPEGRGHSVWTGTPPQDGALPCWHRHHKATPRDRDQGKERNQPDPEYFTHQNNVPTNSYRYYFAVLQSNSTCGIINQCDFDLRWIMTQACGSTKKISATFVVRRFPLRSIAEWTGCHGIDGSRRACVERIIFRLGIRLVFGVEFFHVDLWPANSVEGPYLVATWIYRDQHHGTDQLASTVLKRAALKCICYWERSDAKYQTWVVGS